MNLFVTNNTTFVMDNCKELSDHGNVAKGNGGFGTEMTYIDDDHSSPENTHSIVLSRASDCMI